MKADDGTQVRRVEPWCCEAEIVCAEYVACAERTPTEDASGGSAFLIASLNVVVRLVDSPTISERDIQYGAGVRNAHTRTSRYRGLLKAARMVYEPALQFAAHRLIGRRVLVRVDLRYDHLVGVHPVIADVFPTDAST
jgi:hypothetical protein